jgi:hypothetical protein
VRYLSFLFFLCLFLGAKTGALAQEEEPYKKEFDYGINFNTRGGLIGGAMIKSSSFLKDSWYRYWGVEVVLSIRKRAATPARSPETFIFTANRITYTPSGRR